LVASNIELPNLRKCIVPSDPNNVFLDVDLKGADAQVVAWDANDEDLKAAFRAGLDVHTKNAEDLTTIRPITDFVRFKFKRRVHATNYGGSAYVLAATNGSTLAEEERFQDNWFGLHPAIKDWQNRTQHAIDASGEVRNAFGYRIKYFGRPQDLLKEALAWIGQSTTAITCERGGLQVQRNVPWIVSMRMQVHDSWLIEIPQERLDDRHIIKKHLEVVVPYDDPLIIPWDLKVSGKSWGHCQSLGWEN